MYSIFEALENFRFAIFVLYFVFFRVFRAIISLLHENKNQFIYLSVPPIITLVFPHHTPLNAKADPRKDRYSVILLHVLFASFLGLDERHVSFAESSQLNFSPRRTTNPEVHYLFPANTYAFRAHTRLCETFEKKTSAWRY